MRNVQNNILAIIDTTQETLQSVRDDDNITEELRLEKLIYTLELAIIAANTIHVYTYQGVKN